MRIENAVSRSPSNGWADDANTTGWLQLLHLPNLFRARAMVLYTRSGVSRCGHTHVFFARILACVAAPFSGTTAHSTESMCGWSGMSRPKHGAVPVKASPSDG